MNKTEEQSNRVHQMRDNILIGLGEIDDNENWAEEYETWKSSDANQFDSLLEVINPFDLSDSGNRHIFDLSDLEDLIDHDIICMSVFLSDHLLERSRRVFSDIRKEKNRDNKLKKIEEYFGVVDRIAKNNNLAGCILTLNDLAEKQMVLCGSRSLDLYSCFFSLKENLRKRSTESIYFLFTYWRITKAEKAFDELISSITDYLQTYFYEFDRDPDMHLFYPLEGKPNVTKLDVITHWCEYIAFHTDGIFRKYKDLKWLAPADQMVDEIIETNQISKFEMSLYQEIFASDDADTVRKKAICNHGYAIWIKTVDVMHVVCDIFQVLYRFSDGELNEMGITRAATLEGLDNMTKIRDYYTGKVFFHQVYYQLERCYFDSRILDALEEDAKTVSESVDDAISLVNAIAADDIESLLQAKHNYITGLSEFISVEQEEKLDGLTQQVVDKIKATIQKLDVYDTLYQSVSKEFLPYSGVLVQHPQIFSSLVSAEYLYQQYVESKPANPKFDYSCISIMYYMSLEDFLNKLVYTPYANEVLSRFSRSDINDVNWRRRSRRYVSRVSSFWDNKNERFKTACEIGPLGFLYEGIDNETEFKNYIVSKYPKTDTNRIKALGTQLKNIAPRRNNAAHGGNYLTYTDVQADKEYVYDISVNTFRGLLLEFLDIIL